jgi:hypothetical protein
VWLVLATARELNKIQPLEAPSLETVLSDTVKNEKAEVVLKKVLGN